MGSAAGPQRALQRAGDRPLAVVELGVGDGHRGELGELGEDGVVARVELAVAGVDHLEHPELLARGRSGGRTAAAGSMLAAAQARGRGGGERAQPRVGGEDGHRGAGDADDRAAPCRPCSWRISSTVSDRLMATEASASARSCSTCSCSSARDLLDLEVAAVDGLERRQALAQEVRGRLERPSDGGPSASAARSARVVGLGEVEHAEVRGDGLAAEVVGGAQRLLAPVGEVRGERLAVAHGERRASVRPFPGRHGAGSLSRVGGSCANDCGRAGDRRCRAGCRRSSGPS